MADKLNTGNIEQVYNVREDEAISSGVALVLCVLVQRGVFVAGFSITKELLTIHYSEYSSTRPVWELDFFEQLFVTEPLLAVREKVKGVFLAGDKNLVVPDELYAAADAEAWLRKIHFVEHSDRVAAFAMENDKAQLLQAFPLNIIELVKINFKRATVLPLQEYQLEHSNTQSLHLQCFITRDQVFATLHNYSQLLWYQVFDYASAEYIAYTFKNLCKENYIDAAKLHLACTTVSGSEYDVINELTRYFPSVKSGNGRAIQSRCDPAVCLANQLLACVL